MDGPTNRANILNQRYGKALAVDEVPQRLGIYPQIEGARFKRQVTPSGVKAKVDEVDQDENDEEETGF